VSPIVFTGFRPASLLAMTCAHGACRLLGEKRLAHRHGHVRLRPRPRASGGAAAGQSVRQSMPGAACLVPEGFYGRLIVVVAVLSVEDDLALCVNEEQGTDHGAAQALHRRGAQGALLSALQNLSAQHAKRPRRRFSMEVVCVSLPSCGAPR